MGILSSCLSKMLGFSTDEEANLMEQVRILQHELYLKDTKITELEKQSKIFILCPPVRGHRYNKIILPENVEEFNTWLHSELVPTLTNTGKVIGNRNFIKET